MDSGTGFAGFSLEGGEMVLVAPRDLPHRRTGPTEGTRGWARRTFGLPRVRCWWLSWHGALATAGPVPTLAANPRGEKHIMGGEPLQFGWGMSREP